MKKSETADLVKDLLIEAGVQIQPLAIEQIEALAEKWITAFDPEGNILQAQKRKKSKQRICKWDYFSLRGSGACLVGEDAINTYLKQWSADYYVFGEESDYGFLCQGPYVDFFPITADIYVAHPNMKWTIVYTHEMKWDPDLGPFFCLIEK